MTAAAHLSDETIFEFAAGRLDGDQAKVAHVHLDGCPNCRRLLAAASQSATSLRRVPSTHGSGRMVGIFRSLLLMT